MTRNHTAVNHQLMRELNRSLILSSLRKQPFQTRAKLARETGLTRSAISNLIDDLIQHNLIYEAGYKPSTGGRRGVTLALNPEGGAAIAIKISAISIQCILSNFIGEVVWNKSVPIGNTNPQDVLAQARMLIQETLDHNDAQIRVLGICVGIAGIIGRDGEVLYSTHLGWKNVAFREEWEQHFEVAISINNEVSLAALGENHYGSATADRNFIYIEIGNGFGAGIVLDGKLYHGVNGLAGEVGYAMSIAPESDGTLTIQSWEEIVNIPAFIKLIKDHICKGMISSLDPHQVDFETAIKALAFDEPIIINSLQQISTRLGIIIASLINIFDIPTIILGGELGKHLERCIGTIREQIMCYALRINPDDLDLHISTLEPDAVLMGGVAQVFDDILHEPSWNVHL